MARFDAFSADFEHPFINSSPDYSSRNGSYGSRAIGEAATPLSFRERNKRLRTVENEKNQLIEDLIYQLELTEKHLEQSRLDHSRESHFNRDVQLREANLKDQLRQVKTVMDRDPFLLVLIDGDGTIFTNDLIRRGEKGGKEAANILSSAANEYASAALPHLTSPKVVVRIYANNKQLGESLFKAGVVDRMSIFDDFMRGFNSKLSFDFVDAGTQKDRTVDKIGDAFKMNLYNCHCHQIVFGCSHNIEYSHMLEDVVRQDPDVVDHITLLESVPFDGDLARFRNDFKTTRFDDVFRQTRLVLPQQIPKAQAKGPLNTVTATLPALTRVESNGTVATGSTPTTPALNWASMAAAAPFVPTAQKVPPSLVKGPDSPTGTPAIAKNTPGIDRNRLGQRIDKIDSLIPREEIQRIKKLKLCNIFFLQGADACTNTNCSHDHKFPLSKMERKVLTEVARMTPCYYQTDCDDPSCIYGHRCPQSKVGEKECWYKEDCRFWGWGHGIDTRIVKTTRV